MNKPATTKIATAYNPKHERGARRLLDVRRDNTNGKYVVAEIHDGVAVWASSFGNERRAIDHALELGYTEIVDAKANCG